MLAGSIAAQRQKPNSYQLLKKRLAVGGQTKSVQQPRHTRRDVAFTAQQADNSIFQLNELGAGKMTAPSVLQTNMAEIPANDSTEPAGALAAGLPRGSPAAKHGSNNGQRAPGPVPPAQRSSRRLFLGEQRAERYLGIVLREVAHRPFGREERHPVAITIRCETAADGKQKD